VNEYKLSVNKILTGKGIKELEQNIEVKEIGLTNLNKENKKIREDHTKLFKNETFWSTLKIAISLNVECQIVKFDKEDINGDMESCETKNRTDKAF